MCRYAAFAALVPVLALLAGEHQPPAQQQPRKEDRPPRRLPALQPGEQIAALIKKTVDFQGIDDPKATLGEALEQFAKVHRVTFDVNEKAFKAEDLNDVIKTEVAQPNPIPPMRTTFGTLLKKVLARVPAKSGAAFLVRGDRIEVTTEAALREEVWGKAHRGPFLPLVHVTANAWELDDLLAELAAQSGRNITLDPRAAAKARKPVTAHLLNQPLDGALFLLTDMAGLSFVAVDGTYHVTTPERVGELKAAWAKHRGRPARKRAAR